MMKGERVFRTISSSAVESRWKKGLKPWTCCYFFFFPPLNLPANRLLSRLLCALRLQSLARLDARGHPLRQVMWHFESGHCLAKAIDWSHNRHFARHVQQFKPPPSLSYTPLSSAKHTQKDYTSTLMVPTARVTNSGYGCKAACWSPGMQQMSLIGATVTNNNNDDQRRS